MYGREHPSGKSAPEDDPYNPGPPAAEVPAVRTAFAFRIAAMAALLSLAAIGARSAAAEPRKTPEAQVHHDLVVKIDPEASTIEATDRLTFPLGTDRLAKTPAGFLKIRMHAALELESDSAAWSVRPLADEKAPGGDEAAPEGLTLRSWELTPSPKAGDQPGEVVLHWKGKILHPPVTEAENYGRNFARSPGTIGPEGVVLTHATWWVPSLGEDLVSFRLAVDLPAGWDAVSQGRRAERTLGEKGAHVVWDCVHPMEEIYLIASRFSVYEKQAGGFAALAYLRQPDPALAAKYLEATAQYVDMYRRLIGPYPFEKFALVENFWETGYGMPSFTLLGSQVIRLPFILRSSYPHEILHNWWGNSVYVDGAKGNWCEGLTAYMADHLLAEDGGRGAEYRLDTLKKYRAYVREGHDFPLVEFRSRHSGATEAVGYGKSLMLFHMLRRRVGEDAFRKAVSTFYREFVWKSASFGDLADVFSRVAGEDLRPCFQAWVARAGAPVLALEVAREGSLVHLTVKQTQTEDPFPLRVMLALTLEGQKDALVVEMDASARTQTKVIGTTTAATRVDLDPQFDVFRRLDPAEVPATLGEMFGADRVTIVVPAPANDTDAAAWRAVAESWKGGSPSVDIVDDATFAELPKDRAVWVLGLANRASRLVAPLLVPFGAGVIADASRVEFGETHMPRSGTSWAFVARHPASDALAVGWVGSEVPAAIPGLARKMPHYGKYSWLGFSGDEPTNVAKGQWPASLSPLVKVLAPSPKGEVPARGALAVREPLARLTPAFDTERLMGHVRFLADDRLAGRGAGTPGLEQATDYVAKAFADAGLQPGGDAGTWFQVFEEPNGPDGKPLRLRNVVGVLPGTNDAWKTQSAVVGAHVDHLGLGWPDVREGMKGKIHNGADDNASGVSVLIETARALAVERRPRSLVFVAFSGEEWGLKGSKHYVKAMARFPVRDALAMVNLDCVGRLFDKKLLALGTGGAREWPFVVMGVASTTGVETTAVPDDPQGSDQVSFRDAGVPAIQLFSGANEDYHRPSDDVEKIDAAGLAKVALFLRETVAYLGERPESFHAVGAPGKAASPAAPGPEGGRKVLFGSVPDFEWKGPGVRVSSVVADSPAAKGGLVAGDVLVSIAGEAIESLRGYSEILKKHAPGDVVHVVWKRAEKEMAADVTLAAR